MLLVWFLAGRTLSPAAQDSLQRAETNQEDLGISELVDLSDIGNARWIRSHEIWLRCNPISAECLSYIKSNPEIKSPSLEADLEFSTRYASLPKISLTKNELLHDSSGFTEVTEAGLDIYLTELVNNGYIDPKTVATFLSKNRVNLAQANTLIEKLIFISAVNIDLNAANLVVQSNPDSWSVLAPHLEPLSPAELSYQRIFDGELLFAKWTFDGEDTFNFTKPNQILSLLQRKYRFYLEASQESWSGFWGREHEVFQPSTLDYIVNPIGIDAMGLEHAVSFFEYIAQNRQLDGLIALIHAMHDKDMVEPKHQPTTAPLNHWVWKWEDESKLCLVPNEIHPSMQQYANSICADWLGRDESALSNLMTTSLAGG